MSFVTLLKQTARALDLSQIRSTDLLVSHRTDVMHLEFTSKCNLRCTFCAVSQPDYRGRHLDAESIDSLIEGIEKRRPRLVTVNGHGETTIYRNWHLYCDRLLDAGISISIISNFGRPFSDKEVDTLSRFRTIEISCDSHDPEIFAQLRRGAELQTLLDNIDRLRRVARDAGRPVPRLSFSCVVTDKNVLEMPQYAAFVRELGVGHVNFCNLTKYPDLPDAVNPNHVTEMANAELPRALEALEDSFRILDEARIAHHCQDGLLQTLRQKIQALAAPEPEPEPAVPVRSALPGPPPPQESETAFVRYSAAGDEGSTRDCLDPWKFLLIQANREVMPCCWHRPIHSLGSGQQLSEVFNNTRMKRLRHGLLTGRLPADCGTCPTRGRISVEALREKVWRYLNNDQPYLGWPWAMRIAPERLEPFVVEYGAGWYAEESDPAIDDEQWRTWRWTAPRAECRVLDCQPDGVLILRLGVNKALCPDQEITITVNQRTLDVFVPLQAKSTREYVVGHELLGPGGELRLTIATDKPLVPAASETGSRDRRELGLQVFELFYGCRG